MDFLNLRNFLPCSAYPARKNNSQGEKEKNREFFSLKLIQLFSLEASQSTRLHNDNCWFNPSYPPMPGRALSLRLALLPQQPPSLAEKLLAVTPLIPSASIPADFPQPISLCPARPLRPPTYPPKTTTSMPPPIRISALQHAPRLRPESRPDPASPPIARPQGRSISRPSVAVWT